MKPALLARWEGRDPSGARSQPWCSSREYQLPRLEQVGSEMFPMKAYLVRCRESKPNDTHCSGKERALLHIAAFQLHAASGTKMDTTNNRTQVPVPSSNAVKLRRSKQRMREDGGRFMVELTGNMSLTTVKNVFFLSFSCAGGEDLRRLYVLLGPHGNCHDPRLGPHAARVCLPHEVSLVRPP